MSYNDPDEKESGTKKRRGTSDGGDAPQEPVPVAPQGDSAEGGGRPVGRQEAAQIAVAAAIEEEIQRSPPGGVWELEHCAYNIIQRLKEKDPEQCEMARAFAFLADVRAQLQRRLNREIKTEARADAKEGLLARKGFTHVSPVVKVGNGIIVPITKATAEQKRQSTKDLAKRIQQNRYPRVSKETMKRDEARLADERRFDRKVIPLTAGDKQMELGFAMEAFDASLETPRAKHYQAIASKGGKAKSARTKNQ